MYTDAFSVSKSKYTIQSVVFHRVDMADKKGKSVPVKRTLTKREQEEIKKKVSFSTLSVHELSITKKVDFSRI